MTEIVITPPSVTSLTATSPTSYTVTATQPAAVTVSAALGTNGTVTSIATTAPITGGTITGSGTIGISAATTAAAGSMSASDKTKLDGIETGAEVNNISDANATDLTDGGSTTLHTHASPALVDPSVADNFVSFSNTAGAQKDSGKGLTHLVYTLQWGISANFSPANATTYYIGGSLLQNTLANRNGLFFPMGGTIVSANFTSVVGTTLGSNQTSSAWVRLNNTTDYLISSSIKQDLRMENFVNSSLSISVSAGDYIEIKWTTPTYTTSPTNMRIYGIVMVQV